MIKVKADIHGQETELLATINLPLEAPDPSVGIMGYGISSYSLFWPDGTELKDSVFSDLIDNDADDKIVEQLFESEQYKRMERDATSCKYYDRPRSGDFTRMLDSIVVQTVPASDGKGMEVILVASNGKLLDDFKGKKSLLQIFNEYADKLKAMEQEEKDQEEAEDATD